MFRIPLIYSKNSNPLIKNESIFFTPHFRETTCDTYLLKVNPFHLSPLTPSRFSLLLLKLYLNHPRLLPPAPPSPPIFTSFLNRVA